MLNKSISKSEKVAKLSLEATLLYTWILPQVDVEGRLEADIWTIKAIVPYIDEITPKNIPNLLNEMEQVGLIIYYGDVHKYLQIKDFHKYQKVRTDQEAPSVIPKPLQQQSKNRVKTEQPPYNISKGNISKDKVSKREDPVIVLFWEYFLLKTKKNFRLTLANKDLIKKRLKEGYTIAQLKTAVDRFIEDDWEGRQSHMDLIYCIGKQKDKPDALEKWLNRPQKQIKKLKDKL